MIEEIKQGLWRQFGASIDMLENAIRLCPPALWQSHPLFGFDVYHTLFFLDYYLTPDPVGFRPRDPFTISMFDDIRSETPYAAEDLLKYLELLRQKCRNLIQNLTPDTINNRWINESRTMDYSVFEILLYNMRHVQHHAAQLNLFLRQEIDDAPDWVSRQGERY